MNLKMFACEQLCLLFLLLGVIKFTIGLNNLNDMIDMVRYECRGETEELKNRFSDMRLNLDKERSRNDALERRLKETINNVERFCSGSQNVPNVQTLVKQIDTEKKRNIKQAEQIKQLKEQIELLDFQLEEEKAKRSLLEATTESARMKCDVTETHETDLSSDVKDQDCKFGDQTCAMTTEDESGSMERCEGNQGMKQALLGRSVKSHTQVNVKSDDDSSTPWISGSTVMSNGYIVLCDYYNYKLKMLDSSLNIRDSLTLSSDPFDVSTIDNTSVIVTLPDIHQLQFIQVVPNLKAGRIIRLDKRCFGIVVARDRMYVSCLTGSSGEGEVRILHMNGTMLKQLGGSQDGSIMFTEPYYIAVSQSCDKVFVSDAGTKAITCMSVTGQILYQYKADDLVGPNGMYCDGDDNIFICDWDSDTVQVITAEGKKHGDLVSSADGVSYPYSISYRQSDNTLIIGRSGNYIVTLKLT